MSDQQTEVVVLGSNSFSGSHFVNHCLTEGYSVVGISRSSEPNSIFLPYKKNKYSNNFTFYKLDLNKDLDEIVALINNRKIEYIVNFAAQGMVAQSWDKPEDWFQTNILANVKLHDHLRKLDFLQKYVHVSTPEVYGTCEGLIKEHTNYHPSTPYAVSKAAIDMSLMSFYKAYNFPVVFTRAANVYGPGQQLYRIIPITILKFLTGQKLQLHGGGHSVRSFIHIRDVVDGTLKAMKKGKSGNIFHLSTGVNISIMSLVKMIAEKMNVSFDNNVEIVGERLGKDSAYLLDSSKADSELSWQPEIMLEQGIVETIDWVKRNIDLLKTYPWSYIHSP